MFTEQFIVKTLGFVGLAIIFVCFFVMSFDRLTRGRAFSYLIIISSLIHFLLLCAVNESVRYPWESSLPFLYVIVPLLIILYAFYRGMVLMRFILALCFTASALLSVFFLYGMTMGFIPDSSDNVLIWLILIGSNVISTGLLAFILMFSPSLTQFQRQQRNMAMEGN